jgi:hypothetical protein
MLSGSVQALQQVQPLPGKHSQLLHRQPVKKQELVWQDGCGNAQTLTSGGGAFSCSGPGHEDKGMMSHENHCMMFSTHDWVFSGVDSEFEGGSDGANGGWGTVIDPGTEYCLEVLRHPWDGMVGLQVSLASFPTRLFRCNLAELVVMHKFLYVHT